MKGKILIYAALVFTGLWFFMDTWGVYTLLHQEEVQLFMPTRQEIYPMLLTPGGVCELLGKALVQYYTSPTAVLFILSTLLTLAGILVYRLYEHFIPRFYHYIWALLPVFALAKAHCSPFYVLDGTIGILILLLFLHGFMMVSNAKKQLCYTLFSTLAIYFLAGQMVALYSMGIGILSLLRSPKVWILPLSALLLGGSLTYFTIRYTTCVPLTDGIYSQAYQESQLQPDSYLYFVWIRWTCLLLASCIIVYLLSLIGWKQRWHQIALTLLSGVVATAFASTQIPNQEEIFNNRMEHLAHLRHQGNWDGIIELFQEKHPSNYLQINHLCLALAQKGELADKLFKYNVKGPQTLLATWDHRYYTSSLLCDIHHAIGDVTLTESYAMEGLTLAKRGGSPRMMQHLVEISLIRQEWALAQKYLDILGRMPFYRAWAEKQKAQLYQPSNRVLPQQTDNLFSLLTMDSIWQEHLHSKQPNHIAQAYLGCSYLLGKELDKFKEMLPHIKEESLPKHFQEALLILAIDEPSILENRTMDAQILNHFKFFQQDIRKVSKDNRGLMQLQRQYGDTYWFYYYCKN